MKSVLAHERKYPECPVASEGNTVEFYDSGGTGYRGSAKVAMIDKATNQVWYESIPDTVKPGDIMVVTS